ncbi:type II toxin-antitoxin system PemK/MazF family toxin [Candidatus Tisiphia endosymbiont of Metellina segmentata]|uniref:type II toxin-antitoxin system PemK/MazF family toxin n=1 Tax=Candidatus Tisiphia endosymbiont of Metellina segmentata TaxID=3066274 RepID=UPI00313E263A
MTLVKNKEIIRGNIYWVNLDPTIGTEIQKTRPAIVISNNIQNKISSRVIIIPITSNINNIFPFEVRVTVNNKTTKALTDQIRTIDKSRLGEFIEQLNKTEIINIEKAIKVTLSLT